ncbi:MAG: CapA family protein [Lachnospiraceae bacterium]|nr:CapA family protein [Lachnospiraceae bacterium]
MKFRNHQGTIITRFICAGICLLGFSLCGCGLIDELGDAMGFPMSDESTEQKESVIETIEDGADPVIVIETPEEEQTEEAGIAEETEEEEEVFESIRDFDNRYFTLQAASKDHVTLSFIGDINFCEGYANMRVLRDEEGGNLSGCILPEVMQTMQDADIMMANNEFSYSDRGAPTAGKKYTFRASPEHVTKLNEMGVDIVALANNHAYDWGPDALMDTFDILEGADVPYVGAGRNLAEAMQPVYIRINGRTIAYVAATQIERTPSPDTKEATETEPGVLRTLDPKKFVSVIEEAEKHSDFTVVYVHWGSENTDLVEASQRELAEKYVAAGADLIIGDHSHCLQGIDYVNGVPVFYSLGNFWFNSKTVDTCIVTATIKTEKTTPAMSVSQGGVTEENFADTLPIESLRFIPCIQKGCRTKLADAEESERILAYLQGICDHAAVDPEGYITYSEENRNTQGGMNTSPSRGSSKPEGENADPSAAPAVPEGAESATPAEESTQEGMAPEGN